MKIVLCDDQPYFLDVISNYCMKYENEFNVPITIVKFKKGIDVISYFEQKNSIIDLFILDIMMKEIDGLKIAERIRRSDSKTKIVFLTSALEFAPLGYAYGINRYWMKPLSYETFSLEMNSICEEIKKENNLYLIESIGNSLEKVYFEEIMYIETFDKKVCVHKTNSTYISNTKLIEYEGKLDERFFRCHAAYIVNMNFISKIRKLEITLNNGEAIYISKGKKKSFFTSFSRYIGLENSKYSET